MRYNNLLLISCDGYGLRAGADLIKIQDTSLKMSFESKIVYILNNRGQILCTVMPDKETYESEENCDRRYQNNDNGFEIIWDEENDLCTVTCVNRQKGSAFADKLKKVFRKQKEIIDATVDYMQEPKDDDAPEPERELTPEEKRQYELERLEILNAEDDEHWAKATELNTMEAYDGYLAIYDVFPPKFRGKYVTQAKTAQQEITKGLIALCDQLYTSMRSEPWSYDQTLLKALMQEARTPESISRLRNAPEAAKNFIESGQYMTFDHLMGEGIVPQWATQENVIAPDVHLSSENLMQIGGFPQDPRSDVIFIGLPYSGKSTIMAGIIENVFHNGVAYYLPHRNEPEINENNLNATIDAVACGKFLERTPTDSLSVYKVDLSINNKVSRLNFIDYGGTVIKLANKSRTADFAHWQKSGLRLCLNSNNRKHLFFVIDYSVIAGITPEDIQEHINSYTHLLDILANDGINGSERGCTLSKVDSLSVIVAKSDLMPCPRNQCYQHAYNMLYEDFPAFMKLLQERCNQFMINPDIQYWPHILTHTNGYLYPGNNYTFDPFDTTNLVNFLSYYSK